MSKIRHFILGSALLCWLVPPAVLVRAYSQTPSQTDPKLALKAALVLTPEFCATKTKKGTWGVNRETFPVGKAACAEFEPALKGVFASLNRVDAAQSSGDAQVVLMPRFVDVAATQAKIAFSDREFIVLVEWTVKDKSDKTIWIETVQGSAKRHMGNSFTYKKNLRLIVENAVKNLAAQSASKMSSAPELRKVN